MVIIEICARTASNDEDGAQPCNQLEATIKETSFLSRLIIIANCHGIVVIPITTSCRFQCHPLLARGAWSNKVGFVTTQKAADDAGS
jgi:hypothetical protein